MRLRALREDELPAVLERQRTDYRTQLVEWAGLPPELAGRKGSLYHSLGYEVRSVFMGKNL